MENTEIRNRIRIRNRNRKNKWMIQVGKCDWHQYSSVLCIPSKMDDNTRSPFRKSYGCEEDCSYHSFHLYWTAITLLEKWPEKKFSLWTVFEPTTLVLSVQCSTNWAINLSIRPFFLLPSPTPREKKAWYSGYWAIKATERSSLGSALYVCRSQQTTEERSNK